MKRKYYILGSVILIGAFQTLCIAGPLFWVKCSSCKTTQSNSIQATQTSTENTLFSCGTGMFPGDFRVLVQCEQCHRLGTLNLLQAEYDASVEARQNGSAPPDFALLRKKLMAVASKYNNHSAQITQACSLCEGQMKILYLQFNALSGEEKVPEEIKIPLSAECPDCGSNTLEAISAGSHFD